MTGSTLKNKMEANKKNEKERNSTEKNIYVFPGQSSPRVVEVRVTEELGRGNFGVVLKASLCDFRGDGVVDSGIKKEQEKEEHVAIKWIPFPLSSSPHNEKTTLRECNILYSIQSNTLYYHLMPPPFIASGWSATPFASQMGQMKEKPEFMRNVNCKKEGGERAYFSGGHLPHSSEQKEEHEEEEEVMERKYHLPKTSYSRREEEEGVAYPSHSILFLGKPLFAAGSVFPSTHHGNSQSSFISSHGGSTAHALPSPLPFLQCPSRLPPSWATVGLQFGCSEGEYGRHVTGHPNIIRLYGYYRAGGTVASRIQSSLGSREKNETKHDTHSWRNSVRHGWRKEREARGGKHHKECPPSPDQTSASPSRLTFASTSPSSLYLMMEMMPTNLKSFISLHFSGCVDEDGPYQKKSKRLSHKGTALPLAEDENRVADGADAGAVDHQGITTTPTLAVRTRGSQTTHSSSSSKSKFCLPSFPLLYVKLIIFQVARGLCFLHSFNICHCDVKPQNILMNEETGEVKICDFGSAKRIPPPSPLSPCAGSSSSPTTEHAAAQRNTAYVCSRFYRAPELLLGSMTYGPAVDMWSLGCILAELLHIYLATNPFSAAFCRRRKKGEAFFQGPTTAGQLVEIFKVLGTPSRRDLMEMSPSGATAMEQVFGGIWRNPVAFGRPSTFHYLYTAAGPAGCCRGCSSSSMAPSDTFDDDVAETLPSSSGVVHSRVPSPHTGWASSFHPPDYHFHLPSPKECFRNEDSSNSIRREGGEGILCKDDPDPSPHLRHFPSHFRVLPKPWKEVFFRKTINKLKKEEIHRITEECASRSTDDNNCKTWKKGKEVGSGPHHSVSEMIKGVVEEPHGRGSGGGKEEEEENIPFLPADAIDLLNKMLSFVPSQRLTAAEVVEHRFFNDLFSKRPDDNSKKEERGEMDLSHALERRRSHSSSTNSRNNNSDKSYYGYTNRSSECDCEDAQEENDECKKVHRPPYPFAWGVAPGPPPLPTLWDAIRDPTCGKFTDSSKNNYKNSPLPQMKETIVSERGPSTGSSYPPTSSDAHQNKKWTRKCLPISSFMLTPEETRLYSSSFIEKMRNEVETIRNYLS